MRNGALTVLKAYECNKLRHRQVQNVFREIRLLSRLNTGRHGGIVELLAAWEEEEYIYLAFAPCMRGDVYQLFVKEKERGLSEHYVASQIVMPLLSTLDLLHHMGIVHRDIKPENLFISLEGELQVGDFGLAADKTVDTLTERVGTLDYMAPEVLAMPTPDERKAGRGRNQKPYDEKVDLWAVGVLCYELLVGQPPYEVEDPKETAKLILAAKPPAFPTHLSDSAVDFIRRALSKKAAQRPCAAEMLKHPWVLPHSRPPCAAATTSPAWGPVTPDLPRTKGNAWSASDHMSPCTSRGSQSLDPVTSDDSTRTHPGDTGEDHSHSTPPRMPPSPHRAAPSRPTSGSAEAEDVQAVILTSSPGGAGAKGAGAALPPLSPIVVTVAVGQRRASSGTSEYHGYATPAAKPSSPEHPSRSASMVGLDNTDTGLTELPKSVSAFCLHCPPDSGAGGDAGAGGGGGDAGTGAGGDHQEGTAIAWQSAQLVSAGGAGAAKRPVGKSRFAR